MSILQMRYFLVLAKHENLAKAADELQVSPSTLSKSIARLEREMGVKLFDRSEHGLKLNQAGLVAKDGCTDALRILDDMQSSLEDIANKENQHLRIISVSNLSGIGVISAFAQKHPNCYIYFKASSAQDVARADIRNDYDFIIAGPALQALNELESHPISNSAPVLMVPKGHPLTRLENLSLADIVRYPLIMSPSGSGWEAYLEQVFREKGLTPHVVSRGTHSLRCQLVAAGLGISLSTMNGIRSAPPPKDSVEILHLSNRFPPRYTYLYWNKNRQTTKAMRQFRQFTADWFRDNQ